MGRELRARLRRLRAIKRDTNPSRSTIDGTASQPDTDDTGGEPLDHRPDPTGRSAQCHRRDFNSYHPDTRDAGGKPLDYRPDPTGRSAPCHRRDLARARRSRYEGAGGQASRTQGHINPGHDGPGVAGATTKLAQCSGYQAHRSTIDGTASQLDPSLSSPSTSAYPSAVSSWSLLRVLRRPRSPCRPPFRVCTR